MATLSTADPFTCSSSHCWVSPLVAECKSFCLYSSTKLAVFACTSKAFRSSRERGGGGFHCNNPHPLSTEDLTASEHCCICSSHLGTRLLEPSCPSSRTRIGCLYFQLDQSSSNLSASDSHRAEPVPASLLEAHPSRITLLVCLDFLKVRRRGPPPPVFVTLFDVAHVDFSASSFP